MMRSPKNKSRVGPRRLAIEALEDRRLLAHAIWQGGLEAKVSGANAAITLYPGSVTAEFDNIENGQGNISAIKPASVTIPWTGPGRGEPCRSGRFSVTGSGELDGGHVLEGNDAARLGSYGWSGTFDGNFAQDYGSISGNWQGNVGYETCDQFGELDFASVGGSWNSSGRFVGDVSLNDPAYSSGTVRLTGAVKEADLLVSVPVQSSWSASEDGATNLGAIKEWSVQNQAPLDVMVIDQNTPYIRPPGASHIAVIADPVSPTSLDGLHLESNEKNNFKVLDIRPQLAISQMAWDITTGDVQMAFSTSGLLYADTVGMRLYWADSEVTSLSDLSGLTVAHDFPGVDIASGNALTFSIDDLRVPPPDTASTLVAQFDYFPGRLEEGFYPEEDEWNNVANLELRPDLVLSNVDFELHNITFESGKFIWSDTITVHNAGLVEADNVAVRLEDGEKNVIETHTISLGAESGPELIDAKWDLTSLLVDGNGVADLKLRVLVDPDNEIDETNERNNRSIQSLTVDARPVVDIQSQYKPGTFLQNVSLVNEMLPTIDWNGNLPGTTLDSPTSIEVKSGANLLASSAKQEAPYGLSFDLGSALPVGTSTVSVTVAGYSDFPTETVDFDYTIIRPPNWALQWDVKNASQNESATGSDVAYNQVAEYEGNAALISNGLTAAFQVPAILEMIKGIAGVTLTTDLRAKYRSDSTEGSITGAIKASAKIASRVRAVNNFTLDGRIVRDADTLKLASANLDVHLGLGFTSPAVPIPKIPFLRYQFAGRGTVGGRIEIRENSAGELEFTPTSKLLIQVVLTPVKTFVGVESKAEFGGRLNIVLDATLDLSGANGCYVESVTVHGKGKLYARFAHLQSEYVLVNYPDPPWSIKECKTVEGGSEGEAGNVVSDLVLAPSTAGDHFKQLNGQGSPEMRYAGSNPQIVNDGDTSRMMIWVDEDPDKPQGAQLEIVASQQVNGTWEQPVAITDDSTNDFQPAIGLLHDGRVLAAWTRLHAVAPENFYDELESLQVVTSIYDPSSDSWSDPVVVGNQLAAEHSPRIIAGHDRTFVTYLSSQNHGSIFPGDERELANTLMVTAFDGESWLTPSLLDEGIPVRSAPQSITAIQDGEESLLTFVPSTGDEGGIQLHILRQGLSTEAVLVPSEKGVSTVKVAKQRSEENDEIVVAWINREDEQALLKMASLQGTQLTDVEEIYSTQSMDEPTLAVDDTTDQLAIVWQEHNQGSSEIMYRIRNREGGWGAIQNAGKAGIPGRTIHVDLSNGQLTLGVAMDGSNESLTALGEPNQLESFTFPIGSDLSITETTFSSVPLAGEELQIYATVVNLGSQATTASDVALFVNGEIVDSQQLPVLNPGGSTVIPLTWQIPSESAQPPRLTIVADAGGTVSETNESNNVESVSDLQPNLYVRDARTELVGNDLLVTFDVVAEMISGELNGVSARVVTNDENGPSLVETTIAEAIRANERHTITLKVEDAQATLSGIRRGFILLDPLNQIGENDETDNSAFVPLNPFSSWTNPIQPFDVDDDGRISPVDALLIINELNRVGTRRLPVPPAPDSFIDANTDWSLSPLDALLIINRLNSSEDGEGEAPASTSLGSYPLPHPLGLTTHSNGQTNSRPSNPPIAEIRPFDIPFDGAPPYYAPSLDTNDLDSVISNLEDDDLNAWSCLDLHPDV